jgi:hypothetical protein
MIISFPDRHFQLWEYRVSHGSLLVRSPRGPRIPNNIDIIFAGVEFLSMPRHLRGLELDQGHEDEDIRRVSDEFGDVEPSQVYVLISAGRRHVLVAAGLEVRQHGGDIFDSPFE